MSIKKKLYDVLISRNPPIRRCYVRYKEQGNPPRKRAVYLFRLSFSYHILRDRTLSGYDKNITRQYCRDSESSLSCLEAPESLAEKLSDFEAVSFDIFDTLIYRPFSRPVDLFHIAGAKAGLLNFAEIRAGCEWAAREIKFAAEKTREVDIDDIYDYMTGHCGTGYAKAKEYELEAELELCFANPYMKRVWDILRQKGTRIVVISDMYLKAGFLEGLLVRNGFEGFEKLFVSNEYKRSKYDGQLYETAKKYLGCTKIAHVGDNFFSDIEKSREHGLTPFQCNNPNFIGNMYRPDSISRLVGSAYSGTVNARFHSGLEKYPMLYEYGYAYSGIFVLGYCNFIHELQLKTGADKILFLARDGDLLNKVYKKLYPESSTEYFLWSRLAAVKLCARENTLDFIRRFVYHKSNGTRTAGQLLREMEQEKLLDGFKPGDIIINGENSPQLADYIIENIDIISENFRSEEEGARRYFKEKLADSKRALAVDVGWAGSGAAAIAQLAEKWGFETEIIGVVAGTNHSGSEQPDASEALLQSGRMYSYCFSQRHNRRIFDLHDSSAGHNIFFEMLLGSESPSLKGFAEDGEPVFAPNEKDNAQTVRLIHSGALDFVEDYTARFKKYPFMLDISGSDAYAPFLSATKGGGKYFKAVLGNCSFNIGVGETNGSTVGSQI